ncbi:MAG TPA: methyl-accepting chemotaxis protein [Steroidobacteraceae bacterium]|nr:methyl-accepting chemotaxis protein [Steroidobacteraceae bacterium]
MRVNHPVTANEYPLRDGTLIVSTTDLKGRIVSVNTEFVQVSGFTEDELIGKAHNIVRHPDMPEEAFADFWRTLSAGHPWTGLVKNRRKNGDFYWVVANATPLRRDGSVVGYMSVRTKPTQAQVAAAESGYRAFRENRADGLTIRGGRIVRRRVWGADWLKRAGLARTLLTPLVIAALPVVGAAVVLLESTVRNRSVSYAAATLLVLSWIATLLVIWRLCGRTASALHEVAGQLAELAQERFSGLAETEGVWEVSEVERALQSLRIQMAYRSAETRREGLLMRQALEKASASVMLADENLNVVYVNESARRLFTAAQHDFRNDLPAFAPEKILGSNIDIFHRNPARQRQLLEGLREAHTADIRIGGRAMRIVATPVTDVDGRRIGTGVEWFDRTQEVRAEEEVNEIVRAALAGDLTRRVGLEDKTGFFQVLGRGLNELLQNMAAIVTEIQDAAAQVRIGAEEISAGNANLSQRTEEQSSSLEETASSMEEMTGSVRHNADNASHAKQLALAARDQAEQGGMVVGNAVAAMEEINTASRKIAEIIALVDEMAFQTNLLALNAAVEAARAGEHGWGFAVVAGEVRNLAGRSAKAASQIKQLIEDSVVKVRDGTAHVTQSGQVLEQIVVSIKKVTDIVAEIAAASLEQSAGIEQVNQAVAQMDSMTQQNAALVEEAAAAARAMADQVNRLTQLIGRYRLENGDAGR